MIEEMRIFYGLVLTAVSSALVACSLSSVDHGARIVVRIEDRSEGPGARLAPVPFASTTPPPTAVTGFDCIGVNVTGPGIPDTSRNPETNLGAIFDDLMQRRSYCTYRGLLAGPISTQSAGAQEISLLVPPGSPRLVQLIGLKERNGSNDCYREFLNLPEPSPGPSGKIEADAFEIGRAVVNLTGDTTVSINADWNGLSAADQLAREVKCNDGAVSPSPTPAPVTVSAGPSMITARGYPAFYYDARVAPSRIWVSGGGVNTFESFDFGTGTWSAGPTLSYSPGGGPVLAPVASNGVVSVGGQGYETTYASFVGGSWGAATTGSSVIAFSALVRHSDGATYVFGGTNGSTASNAILKIAPTGPTPTPAPTVLTVARQRAAATEISGGKMIIVGGATAATASLDTCDTYYSSGVPPVATCATYPTLVQEGALLSEPSGGAIYLGGFSSTTNAYLANVNKIAASLTSWSVLQPMGMGRSQFRAFWNGTNTKIIVIGGKTGSTTATATTEIYDLATNAWSLGPSLATARYGYGAVQVGADIFVFGGYGATGTALSSMEIIHGF